MDRQNVDWHARRCMEEIFYRYVEQPELDDIRKSGVLKEGRSSCGRGKWVAQSAADALAWGHALDPAKSGKVIRITVPKRTNRLSYDKLDNIGPAQYLEEDELPLARVEDV